MLPILNAFVAAMLSGALLWLAFFPMNLGPVGFVAMAPFLALVRTAPSVNNWRYLAAFAGGLTFSLLALKWICVAHPMMAAFAWPMMSVYCALYWPVALFLLRKLDRGGAPLVIAFPVVWVALEYFRAHFPTGFPFLQSVGAYQLSGFGWYFLGYTQHANIPMLQAADLGGVYILSFAVAGVNVAAHEWFSRIRLFRYLVGYPQVWKPATFTREMTITAAAFAMTFLLIIYGTYRMVHPPFAKGPIVAVLQGDIPQDQKNVRGEQKGDTATTPLDKVYRDTLAVGASRRDPQPDLIVWPETCWADNWFDTTASQQPPEEFLEIMKDRKARGLPAPEFGAWIKAEQEALAQQVINKTAVHALIGLNGQTWNGTRWEKGNTALLLRPDGKNFYGGRYDKMHLVPFGEYVPFRETFPWLKNFTPYTHDYSCTPGAEDTRFELPARPAFRSGKILSKEELNKVASTATKTYRFGVLICYEDTEPYLARQYNQSSGRPNPVDFLINMSNDGWFTGTEQHEQHLAIARFRAVEARRSLLRAVNMGISAFIDPDGRIIHLPNDQWETSKGLGSRAIISESVPLDNRESLYAQFGDWVPALTWILLALGLITGGLRQRKSA